MALNFLGNWNAFSNTPSISNGSGTVGDVYIVSVSGTQNLGSGTINYRVGTSVIYIASGQWIQETVTYNIDLASVYGSGGGGGMSNPMTTLGDMITAFTAGAPIRLPIGSAGQYLQVVGGVPTWTTLTIGLITLNGDNTSAQTLSVGTSGTDFDIVDNGLGNHAFNLPTASAANRGALSTTDWSAFSAKQAALTGPGIVRSIAGVVSYISGTSSQFVKGDGSLDPTTYLSTSGATNTYIPYTGATTDINLNTHTITNGIATTGFTIAGVTMTLGSDGTGDIYYRNSGGILTRLGIGSPGQALRVSSGGLPNWETSGSTSGFMFTNFSNASAANSIATGGTGQTTAIAAFNALSPMTNIGDILYQTSGSTAARLGIGSIGQVLKVSALGYPYWESSGTTSYTGLVETIAFEDSGSSIAAQTYTLDLYANYGYTINSLNIICASGTATAAVQIGGVNVTSLSAIAVSSTISSTNASGANTVAVGNKVTLVITSPSSLVNLQAGVRITRL